MVRDIDDYVQNGCENDLNLMELKKAEWIIRTG